MSKNDKREDIVRAAKELIAENGFHGAPMAMIADHANVGAGTIYRYFENKDVLITELYKDLEERMYPFILDGYAADKPLRERFLHLGTSLLRYFIENPLDFRYLEQFHNSPTEWLIAVTKFWEKRKGAMFSMHSSKTGFPSRW